MNEWRGTWIGAVVAVASSLLLTVLAAALESSVNGPGHRNVAAPILWAFGGGAGLVLGGFVASFLTRKFWPGAVAALAGAAAFLVLVVLAYNSGDLRTEDQVVGSLIVVVLPGLLVALLVSEFGALVARLVGRRQPVAQ
jgi:hypothetical protein